VQAALTHLLRTDSKFELVGVWPDGESLLQALDGCHFDVVVPDLTSVAVEELLAG